MKLSIFSTGFNSGDFGEWMSVMLPERQFFETCILLIGLVQLGINERKLGSLRGSGGENCIQMLAYCL